MVEYVVSIKQLKAVLPVGKNEIALLVLYGSLVSIFSLIVPLAAQGLVTIVSFGNLRQPLFMLVIIVLVLLSLAALFRVLQAILVENILQQIFTRFALSLGKNIPKFDLAVFDDYSSTELTNRFFEIFILQKALSELLLSGIGFFLQVIFGLLLLALYHPLLLLFSFFLVIFLVLSVWLPWKSGLYTALKESTEKYEVAFWMQELSRLSRLFKFSNNAEYSYRVADAKIASYLRCRQNHFSKLLLHINSTQVIQVLASTSLLLLGGILIIKNQLSLGQLVAAEIVVTALGASVAKLSKYLENIYDLYASVEKLSFLLELPLDVHKRRPSHVIVKSMLKSPPTICLKNITYSVKNKVILNDINVEALPDEKIIIFGERGSGKSLLVKIILGFLEPSQGDILYNTVPLREYDLPKLRNHIFYIENIQIFAGSLLDNLIMQHADIEMSELQALLAKFDLTEDINALPNGLNTELHSHQHLLSTATLQKLMFVRARLSRKPLLIIDNALDAMPDESIQLILDVLHSPDYPCTVIATTRRQDVANLFTRCIRL
jgi:putative ABC transport system ATP-binding protein